MGHTHTHTRARTQPHTPHTTRAVDPSSHHGAFASSSSILPRATHRVNAINPSSLTPAVVELSILRRVSRHRRGRPPPQCTASWCRRCEYDGGAAAVAQSASSHALPWVAGGRPLLPWPNGDCCGGCCSQGGGAPQPRGKLQCWSHPSFLRSCGCSCCAVLWGGGCTCVVGWFAAGGGPPTAPQHTLLPRTNPWRRGTWGFTRFPMNSMAGSEKEEEGSAAAAHGGGAPAAAAAATTRRCSWNVCGSAAAACCSGGVSLGATAV